MTTGWRRQLGEWVTLGSSISAHRQQRGRCGTARSRDGRGTVSCSFHPISSSACGWARRKRRVAAASSSLPYDNGRIRRDSSFPSFFSSLHPFCVCLYVGEWLRAASTVLFSYLWTTVFVTFRYPSWWRRKWCWKVI